MSVFRPCILPYQLNTGLSSSSPYLTLGMGPQGTARKTSRKSLLSTRLAHFSGLCLSVEASQVPTCEQHEPGQQEEGGGVEGRVGSKQG